MVRIMCSSDESILLFSIYRSIMVLSFYSSMMKSYTSHSQKFISTILRASSFRYSPGSKPSQKKESASSKLSEKFFLKKPQQVLKEPFPDGFFPAFFNKGCVQTTPLIFLSAPAGTRVISSDFHALFHFLQCKDYSPYFKFTLNYLVNKTDNHPDKICS